MLLSASNEISPEPEPIAALVVMSLLAPFAVKVTVPDPVALTAPLTVTDPVFVTVTLPPLALLVMPLIVRGPAVLSAKYSRWLHSWQ